MSIYRLTGSRELKQHKTMIREIFAPKQASTPHPQHVLQMLSGVGTGWYTIQLTNYNYIFIQFIMEWTGVHHHAALLSNFCIYKSYKEIFFYYSCHLSYICYMHQEHV